MATRQAPGDGLRTAGDGRPTTDGLEFAEHSTAKDISADTRPSSLDIDLSAITANVRSVEGVVGPDCRVMAVVKADGYGLGAPWVAAAALEGGASALAVACVSEGVQLRDAGYGGPILVMSYVPPEEARNVVRSELTLVIHRASTALALETAAAEMGLPERSVPVHIKIDTGLGRYGCLPQEFLPMAQELAQLPHLRLEGLMTHFADAGNVDLTFAREQLALFNRLRLEAAEQGLTFEIVHAANSAAALALPEARFDMVRVGIMLSGYLPAAHLASKINLMHAVTLRSYLARVYQAEEGDSVGYGRTWRAQGRSLVGLVPLGYADGYRRVLSNRGEVLVRGMRCPVIGTVSMDQLSVDLSGLEGGATEGDEVVLIGRQGADEISADEVAVRAGTISYEIFCGLSRRVSRIYRREGKSVEAPNLGTGAERSLRVRASEQS